MTPVTDAVVLAAGEGSRLRPLTRYRPKPMLPVANRPIIRYVLDALREAGVTRAVLVVGHRRNRLQSHLADSYRGLDLEYVEQSAQLGSGHALQRARDRVDDEFVVVNGDNVVDGSMIRETVEHHRRQAPTATVAVVHSDAPEEYGAVLTREGEITHIVEPSAGMDRYCINAGVYVFDGTIFEALSETRARDGELYLTDAIARLPGVASAVEPDGAWFDPSYPWELLSVTETLLSSPERFGGSLRVAGGVDESARVHESSIVEDAVVIGPDCEVCAGSVLRTGTCLRENARIGPNTVVDCSLVGTDVRIGSNVVLRDSVVGDEATVTDGTVSPGGSADVVVNGRMHEDRQLGGVIGDRASVGPNATLEPGTRVGPEATIGGGVTVRGWVNAGTEVTV